MKRARLISSIVLVLALLVVHQFASRGVQASHDGTNTVFIESSIRAVPIGQRLIIDRIAAVPAPPCGTLSPWTVSQPITIAADGIAVANDGTYVYAAGGWTAPGVGARNLFARYDVAANAWNPLPDAPIHFFDANAIYIPTNNRLYIFGGVDGTNSVLNTTRTYDLATGTWATAAAMPSPRWHMGAGYWNGKVYLVGGFSTFSGFNGTPQAQTWEYDPATDTWNTSLANMPQALGSTGSAEVNGHLYITGGRDSGSATHNSNYDYDIATDTWTSRANLLIGLDSPGNATLDGLVYLIGGGNPFLGSSTTRPDTTGITQIYNPATDT